MTISRKQKCIYHTITRIRERYGFTITEADYEDMLDQVLDEENDTVVVHRDDGSTLHKVSAAGNEPVLVLLDPTGTIIKTAYPLDTPIAPWVVNDAV